MSEYAEQQARRPKRRKHKLRRVRRGSMNPYAPMNPVAYFCEGGVVFADSVESEVGTLPTVGIGNYMLQTPQPEEGSPAPKTQTCYTPRHRVIVKHEDFLDALRTALQSSIASQEGGPFMPGQAPFAFAKNAERSMAFQVLGPDAGFAVQISERERLPVTVSIDVEGGKIEADVSDRLPDQLSIYPKTRLLAFSTLDDVMEFVGSATKDDFAQGDLSY